MPQAPIAFRAKVDSVDLWTDVAKDLWQVEMENGAICAMSVDELDAAFSRGEIGLSTRVQRPSGGDWSTLSEAAGVDGDSIRPVSSEIELIELPKPPPLPKRVAAVENLTTEDLAVLPKQRKTGTRLAVVAMIGLLVGGLAAWRYMPAHPSPTLATTTIPAPITPIVAPARAADPTPAAPETTPAPEENAAPIVAPTLANAAVANVASAKHGAKHAPAKAHGAKKTGWKHRAKLHAGKRSGKKKHR